MSVVLLLFLIALYWLPTIVAMWRSHRQALPIGVLNLLLGWTVIGWVVAMVWSVTAAPTDNMSQAL